MSIEIRLLTNSDQDRKQYQHLVVSAFKSRRDLEASPATLQWTPTDDYYSVLGLFKDQQLVSMMRIEWISSFKELCIKLDENKYPWDFKYPLGYLAKAATLPAEFNQGWNTVLRYFSLKVFVQWQVHGVLGSMIQGSSRVELMKKMGYEFFVKSTKWNGNLKSEQDVLIGYLPEQPKIHSALQFIESQFGDLLKEVQLQFRVEDIPMTAKIDLKFPWD